MTYRQKGYGFELGCLYAVAGGQRREAAVWVQPGGHTEYWVGDAPFVRSKWEGGRPEGQHGEDCSRSEDFRRHPNLLQLNMLRKF